MKGRGVIYFLLLAVVLFAGSILMVMLHMEQTRERLLDSRPGSLNYLLQSYRNINLLQDKLTHLLENDDDVTVRHQKWHQVQLQFDIVWSVFSVVKISAPGESTPLPAQAGLTRLGDEFLSDHEHLFISDSVPDNATLVEILNDTRVLTEQTHKLGKQYFASTSQFWDKTNENLSKQNRDLWISAILLLVATTLLIWQLFKLISTSTRMFKDARSSEEQLSKVVDELRSGRLEQKAKDSFLAAASHDLRQPLHALGLFVNALENKVQVPEGSVILDKIKQSTAALNSLFNSLLDISRLDAGVVEADPEHFNIGKLLDSLHEEFAQMAAKRGLGFKVTHDDFVAYSDPLLLGRILRNLIDNAIVHSVAGDVTLSCVQKGSHLLISVADDGPGIPLTEQQHIFSEYYQLDNPERDRSKGLGLGLSIVKRLCELLHIDIDLVSEPGNGTRFFLSVPAGEPDALVAVVEPERHAVRHFDFHGQLILVIDDERDVREGMELILLQANCTVLLAESSEAARSMIVEQDLIPNLIIADYRLREGKTGLEAVDEVREELNEEIPAFVITGDTSPDRVREVAESGMQLMHKPVVPSRLFQMLSSMLGETHATLEETG